MEQPEGQQPQQSKLESFFVDFTQVTYTDLQIMARADSRGANFFDKSLDFARTLLQPLNWVRLLEVSTLGVHRSREFIDSSSMTVEEVDNLIEQVRTRSSKEKLDRFERRRKWVVGLSVLNIPVGLATLAVYSTVVGIPILIHAGLVTIETLGTASSIGGWIGPAISNVRMKAREVKDQTQQPGTTQETAPPAASVTEEPPITEPEAPSVEEPPPEVEEPAVEADVPRRGLRETLMLWSGRALEAARGWIQGVFPGRQRAEAGREESVTPIPEVQPSEEEARAEVLPGEGHQPGGEVGEETRFSPDRLIPRDELRRVDTGRSVSLTEYPLTEYRAEIMDTEREGLFRLLGSEGDGVTALEDFYGGEGGSGWIIDHIVESLYVQKIRYCYQEAIDLSEAISHLGLLMNITVGNIFGRTRGLYNASFLQVLDNHRVRLGRLIGRRRVRVVMAEMARIWLGDTLYEAGTRERQGLLRTVARRLGNFWQRLRGGRRRAGDQQVDRTQVVEPERPVESPVRMEDREEEVFGRDGWVPIERYRSQEYVTEDDRVISLQIAESRAFDEFIGGNLVYIRLDDNNVNRAIWEVADIVFQLKDGQVEGLDEVRRLLGVTLQVLQRAGVLERDDLGAGFTRVLNSHRNPQGQLIHRDVAEDILRAWLGDDVYTACGGELEVEEMAATLVVERPEAPRWWTRLKRRLEGLRGRRRGAEDLRVSLDAYRAQDADRAVLIQRERESFYTIAGVEEDGRNTIRNVMDREDSLSRILEELSETVYLVKNDVANNRYDEGNWSDAATEMWIFLEGLLIAPGVTRDTLSEDLVQILEANNWHSGVDMRTINWGTVGREVLHFWLGDKVWEILRRQVEQTEHVAAAPVVQAETASGSVEGFGARIRAYRELVRTRREIITVQELVKDVPLERLFQGASLETTEQLSDLQERERDLLERFKIEERELLFRFLGPRAEEMYSGTTADMDFHNDVNSLIRLFIEMKRALFEEDGTWFESYRELFNTLDTMIVRLLTYLQARDFRLGNAFMEELNRYGVNIEDPSSMPDELDRALQGIVELWLGTDLYYQLQQYIK